jgi:hypothetical protein
MIFVNLPLVCYLLFLTRTKTKKKHFIFLDTDYFTHPMLDKRIDNLIHEHTETINSDIKVISDEIFQR